MIQKLIFSVFETELQNISQIYFWDRCEMVTHNSDVSSSFTNFLKRYFPFQKKIFFYFVLEKTKTTTTNILLKLFGEIVKALIKEGLQI